MLWSSSVVRHCRCRGPSGSTGHSIRFENERKKSKKKKIEEIQSSRRREGSWAPLFYSADYCLFIEMQEIRDGEKKKAQKNQIKWNEKKKKPRPADKAATSTFPSDRFSDEF